MGELSKLPNIGDKLETKLTQVGINTIKDFRKLGSLEAFLRIRAYDPGVCLNTLCALEGALQGVRWHKLQETDKNELRSFYKSLG